MGRICDICKHHCAQYGREWCGQGMDKLFNSPELYEEDCPSFEEEDGFDDPSPGEESTLLPTSVECPWCGEDANQVRNENWYICGNEDCGWEGTINDLH